jgi:hypothetical protein
MAHLRRRAAARPTAMRTTLASVVVALCASALATVGMTAVLHDSLGSGLINFATFGSLAALTAGVLAWELTSNRVCPRCRREGERRAPACATCSYDLRERPRFACTEGHALAFEPGMCDCGRRLIQLRAVPVVRHALATVGVALAVFAALVLAAVLAAVAGS